METELRITGIPVKPALPAITDYEPFPKTSILTRGEWRRDYGITDYRYPGKAGSAGNYELFFPRTGILAGSIVRRRLNTPLSRKSVLPVAQLVIP